jgi:cytochrome c oxidase subunit 1
MASYDNSANPPEPPQPGLARTLFSTDHKAIGLNYLWLALFSVFLGMAMSLLMRIHLVWPGVHLPFLSGLGNTLDRYAALATLHGSLMVFLVLTAAPQAGFGNYFLPLQIGAREMAFPTLNLLSFWATVASLFGMTAAFLIAQQSGITLWIVSVAIFCAASLLNALNFSVTTIDLRAKGMTLPRLPLTVWAWFINAILGVLIFSILLAACVCLLSDRLLSTHLFAPIYFLTGQSVNVAGNVAANVAASAQSMLWQRLFWFFAQAEVYVAMLPCFGLTTHLISTFSRKPVWKERLVVLALCGVGLLGFCVWGEHMFSSGMNPFSPLVFSLLASSLGLPAVILLISWLGTLWNARIQLNTSMLFALGFVSLFMSGGLSGIFLARHDLAAAAVSDDFVTGHFHLVMGVAATFAILGALFFWFPKLFGRRLNEPLGKIHFWLTFAGVYSIFMPMHWLGLVSHTNINSGRRIAVIAAMVGPARTFITFAILLTVAAQVLFLFNFLWSLFRGKKAEECNPWRATTLEWTLSSPPPADDFGVRDPVVYRGAYEFSVPDVAEDFVPQHLTPEQVSKVRQSRNKKKGRRKKAESRK